MTRLDEEEKRLRSVAIQNANSILVARQRAEQELIRAKEALEQKTSELARTLSMIRATLESTTDGILVTDDLGRVTDFNENYVRMFGIPENILGARDHHRLAQFIHTQLEEPSAFLTRIEEIYAQALPETFDVLKRTDGRIFERFSRIQYLEDRGVGRVWSFREVTERVRAEEERKMLLESERSARSEMERINALKDEFLATLSHELRTPLGAILGWSMILRRGTASAAEVQQGLEAIERNARVQTQLIEDLLDMSRIASGKIRLDIQPLQPVVFIDAAIETVRPTADAKSIRLEKLLDPSAGPVSGDPGRLQQVLWNLLINAIKFTPKGGRVQITLERVESHIEISVADTGMGIAPEFLSHVFDRFRQADASTTRSHGGLGLGLSIVKTLVELHGGAVRVVSEGLGCGSTFIVRLPLKVIHHDTYGEARRHPSSSNAGSPEYWPSDLSGIKVLVVEDEGDARDLIRRVLADCQADVIVAATAAEALELIEREKPHVLVSDIGMPDIDGYEFLRKVRALEQEQGGRIPAVALTAFARSEDRTRALRAGFLVHVAKPVEPAELVETIATIVGRTGAPRP